MKYLLMLLISMISTYGIYQLYEHTFEARFFVTYVGGGLVTMLCAVFVSWYESIEGEWRWKRK